MATSRTRRRRSRHLAHLSPAVVWWLRHGDYLSHDEARHLGLTGEPAVLQVWVLQGCDETFGAGKRPLWTRRRLRAAGYGEAIDALVTAGKAPADDAFKRPADTLEPEPALMPPA